MYIVGKNKNKIRKIYEDDNIVTPLLKQNSVVKGNNDIVTPLLKQKMGCRGRQKGCLQLEGRILRLSQNGHNIIFSL